ncbi:hypothetical protein ERY13_21975 [Paenibacillus mucilaginosus]|nr:hypothetical protein ERY13_21975 [Paenibacillus mucilaginosus]
MTKGAVYRRFPNKDEIAGEPFDYAGRVLMEQVTAWFLV